MPPAVTDPQDGFGSSAAGKGQTPESPEEAPYRWAVKPFQETPAVEALCYQRPIEGVEGSLTLGLVSDWPYGVLFTGEPQGPVQGLVGYDGAVTSWWDLMGG